MALPVTKTPGDQETKQITVKVESLLSTENLRVGENALPMIHKFNNEKGEFVIERYQYRSVVRYAINGRGDICINNIFHWSENYGSMDQVANLIERAEMMVEGLKELGFMDVILNFANRTDKRIDTGEIDTGEPAWSLPEDVKLFISALTERSRQVGMTQLLRDSKPVQK